MRSFRSSGWVIYQLLHREPWFCWCVTPSCLRSNQAEFDHSSSRPGVVGILLLSRAAR